MFKKLSIILLILVLMGSISQSNMVCASSVGVVIDGKVVSFTQDSGQPFVDSANRTQVPLRVTMEAYGCTVNWDNTIKIATVEKDGITVEVPIGEAYITVNGGKITNDTTAQIKDGRTYLPIRVVLEAFGEEVKWDGSTRNVIVGKYSNYNILPERTMYLYVYTFDNKGFSEKDLNKADFVFKDGVIVKDGKSYTLYKANLGVTKDPELLNRIAEAHSKSSIYIFDGNEYVDAHEFYGIIDQYYTPYNFYEVIVSNNICFFQFLI